jgi:hypothetical protein
MLLSVSCPMLTKVIIPLFTHLQMDPELCEGYLKQLLNSLHARGPFQVASIFGSAMLIFH